MQWWQGWTIVYCYNYMSSAMRREYVMIQNVRHLQHVIGKPDVGKSCQGRAIKVNARESYDSPCSRSSVDGRGDQNTVILRRMLTSTSHMEAIIEEGLLSQAVEH